MKKQFRDFESAREFVRKLNLKNKTEWREYYKSGDRPNDVPSSPREVYKKEWKGFGDWLGTGNVAKRDKVYRPFKEAREFVRSLNLKSQKEWHTYCKSGNKPDDIPAVAARKYKNKGWVSYGDWLGTGTTALFNIQYRPYKEAREFVRALKLKNHQEWREYCISGEKPNDIPANPENTYKNKGWVSYGDWLGTGNISNRDKVYRSYKEAREFVRKLKLKNHQEWREYCISGKKPNDIPANPWNVYKEWKKK